MHAVKAVDGIRGRSICKQVSVTKNCALLVTGSGGQLARICSRGAKDKARNGSPTAEGQLENRCAFLLRLLFAIPCFNECALCTFSNRANCQDPVK